MCDQWEARATSRAVEMRAVRRTLAILREEGQNTWAAPAWERLARRALVRVRALTLVSLCDEMLEASMTEEQAVATLLTAERENRYRTADIRRAIDLRSQNRREAPSAELDAPRPREVTSWRHPQDGRGIAE